MNIYKITNIVNGKFYIGKTTKTIEERLKSHFNNARNSKLKKIYLYNAIRKYGKENFIIEKIDQALTESELDEKEKHWISNLNPHYNMTSGGEGGNTIIRYTDKMKLIRSKKISSKVKKSWSNLTEEEKRERIKKTHDNTDYKSYGHKVSKKRKEFFAKETQEEKQIRIEKVKEGSKKIKRIECVFCKNKIHPGNYSRHENSCFLNPKSKNYNKKKRTIKKYTFVSPKGIVFTSKSSKKFCHENKLSHYILMKNLGNPFLKIENCTSNANEITYNTIGWCLLKIEDA